jgi:hypothetical protein
MSHHDETKPPSVQRPRIDDEDVEGHAMSRAAAEPDGIARPRIDDDDVEGHRGAAPRADGGPDELGRMKMNQQPRVDGDDEDVEGHYGQLKSPSSRGE